MLPCQGGRAIREYPRRIALNTFLFAFLGLSLTIRRRTLDVRKELRRLPEHGLSLLAMRTPKCTVEHNSLILETLRERIQLSGTRLYES